MYEVSLIGLKRAVALVAVFLWAVVSYTGQVGLPVERIELPVLQGDHWVCIWDDAAGQWYAGFVEYDHSGSVDFEVPEWDRWYWVGLWALEQGDYVYGKWVGHFTRDDSRKSQQQLKRDKGKKRLPPDAL